MKTDIDPAGVERRPEIDAEELSGLIGDIYDAALDHTLWLQVLRSTARFVDGTAAECVPRRMRPTGAGPAFPASAHWPAGILTAGAAAPAAPHSLRVNRPVDVSA